MILDQPSPLRLIRANNYGAGVRLRTRDNPAPVSETRTLGKQNIAWPDDSDDDYLLLDPETVRAVADAARADVEGQLTRARALDTKLSNVAAFCGVSLSVSSTLGVNLLLPHRLDQSFRVAAGATLIASLLCLLAAVWISFRGLKPKAFEGLAPERGERRVDREWIAQDPRQVLWTMASTNYVKLWPRAHAIAAKKAGSVTAAVRWASAGLFGVVLTVVIAVVGSVT